MTALLTSLWRRALPWLALAAAILLFTLGARRTGEKAGRAAERLANIERTNDALRRMLEVGGLIALRTTMILLSGCARVVSDHAACPPVV